MRRLLLWGDDERGEGVGRWRALCPPGKPCDSLIVAAAGGSSTRYFAALHEK
jgi:hypothetical protein